MRRSSGLVLFALGLVLGTGSSAHALNFCFNPGTDAPYGSLAVAEKFRKPARGSCTPINGFDLVVTPGPRLVSGTACLNSAGDTLRVAYVVHGIAVFGVGSGGDVNVSIILPYPALTNGYGRTTDPKGTFAATGSGHANPCIPPVIPIP